jgi:hypothetical protein
LISQPPLVSGPGGQPSSSIRSKLTWYFSRSSSSSISSRHDSLCGLFGEGERVAKTNRQRAPRVGWSVLLRWPPAGAGKGGPPTHPPPPSSCLGSHEHVACSEWGSPRRRAGVAAAMRCDAMRCKAGDACTLASARARRRTRRGSDWRESDGSGGGGGGLYIQEAACETGSSILSLCS